MAEDGNASPQAIAPVQSAKPVSQRVESLLAAMREGVSNGALDEEGQQQVARMIALLPRIRRLNDPTLMGSLEVAAAAVIAQPAKPALAKEVITGVGSEVTKRSSLMTPLLFILRGEGSSAAPVIAGMATLLYFVLPLMWVYLRRLSPDADFFGIPVRSFLVAMGAGGLGSSVSIMVRINEFGALKDDPDAAVLFLTGLFKPVIGASFALFFLAMFKAGLIPLKIDPAAEPYFVLATSFVSGFSERFARDVVSTAERQMSGTPAS